MNPGYVHVLRPDAQTGLVSAEVEDSGPTLLIARQVYMGGCQNYGPFSGPYYNKAWVPKKGP